MRRSRPARGGWIEILCWEMVGPMPIRPAPHGAGGLKSAHKDKGGTKGRSRPARGGWIEIETHVYLRCTGTSRPARGGWIEIPSQRTAPVKNAGPAPHGAGGLKSVRILRLGRQRRPAPHGAGGLKSNVHLCSECILSSPAPHGAGGLKCPVTMGSLFDGIVPPRTGRVD